MLNLAWAYPITPLLADIQLCISEVYNIGSSDMHFLHYCRTPVLGLRLGVDFTFTWDNNDNNDNNNHHLNFLKVTVLGDKERGLGIKDKG